MAATVGDMVPARTTWPAVTLQVMALLIGEAPLEALTVMVSPLAPAPVATAQQSVIWTATVGVIVMAPVVLEIETANVTAIAGVASPTAATAT